MRRAVLLLMVVFSSLIGFAQITIIGRNVLNGNPVNFGKLYVYGDGKLTYTLNTSKQSEFMIQLDFGRVYKVFIQHPSSPLMHFEVNATTIPADKYVYRMTYEFQAELADKWDEDLDTTVYKNPFHRVVFNGINQMVADTAYNVEFNKHKLKKNMPGFAAGQTGDNNILVGKISSPDFPELSLYPVQIECLSSKREIIRTLSSDRLGTFAFCSKKNSGIFSLRLMLSDSSLSGKIIRIYNNKTELLFEGKVTGNTCIWELGTKGIEPLVDNSYEAHVGAKIVMSSQKEKRFFTERTVYLLNKRYTVLDKTTTNLLGAFVFSDIQPDNTYYIAIDRTEVNRGEKADILNKDDKFVGTLDTVMGDKLIYKISSRYPVSYNRLLVAENELQMDVKATIFGDNINNPIGHLKIILLNDAYEPIDSVITDDFGSFKFKYLPFLKRFYLDADNSDNMLDVFRNILIYSNDENLIKIMTHQKGKKFTYRPVSTEILLMREVEIEDPWLKLMDEKENQLVGIDSVDNKLIVENIHFENNKYELNRQAKETLDKIILVLNAQKHLRIEIGAHTDSKGSEEENLKLSQQRAKAVYSYIISAGVDASRLVSKGYGESKPLIVCNEKRPCSESDHAKNRRIEFKIINNTKAK
ncbi:MAG: OmpA family protein [Bacteroidia bacterium]|nr:OmpA family protein [Bacteroidia bacterium]